MRQKYEDASQLDRKYPLILTTDCFHMKEARKQVHLQVNLQAVQGNPPKTATGLVGAVGHIHLICM